MNIIIEEVVSEFPVLITEEIVQITISDAVSYFDIIEVADTSFVGKDGYVPVVNEATGKLVLSPQEAGPGGGVSEAPNNSNAYVRSALSWVIGYTKTAIDNLLNGKFNNPTGNNTQYLDGAGTPTTFPTIPSISGLATETYVDNGLSNKVDKVTGSSLVTSAEKTAITHSNRSILDAITESFTTALKTAYDGAVTWITTNGTNILNHIASTSNPHNVTKSQVGLSNVDNTNDLSKPISTATQTALDLKLDALLNSSVSETATDGAVSSGTSNTYSQGVLISADKISSGNVLDIVTVVRKTGVMNTYSVRFYINNTNDLSGSPILVGASTGIVANNAQTTLQRFLRIKVKNGTGAATEVMNTGVSLVNEYGAAVTSAVSTLAIDWSTDKFLVVAVQCVNAGDSARVSFIKASR